MKAEILNCQKIKKLDLAGIRLYLKKISSLLGLSGRRISFVFCDNRRIKDLNRRFFNRNSPTDVIAFPLNDDFQSEYMGEVVVSVEQTVKAGGEYGNTWKKEMVLYIIHGILHLMGYDDVTAGKSRVMEKKQQEILEKLFAP